MRVGQRKWLSAPLRTRSDACWQGRGRARRQPGGPGWRCVRHDRCAAPSPHWHEPGGRRACLARRLAGVRGVGPGAMRSARARWLLRILGFIVRINGTSPTRPRVRRRRLENIGGEAPGAWWQRQSGLPGGFLSYEFRPGGSRPGPAELWARFDRAVDELGRAMGRALGAGRAAGAGRGLAGPARDRRRAARAGRPSSGRLRPIRPETARRTPPMQSDDV